ncbi:MAG TPA: Rap1a/Tai family immunity protein [Ferrovibrio sp.]|jgi:hypothetical protein|uniref:Rap1a/Tai family immunity protein n=1 Tax=Ferrovibrio sp. TaxID=1917215 RepID=UPI002ED1191B
MRHLLCLLFAIALAMPALAQNEPSEPSSAPDAMPKELMPSLTPPPRFLARDLTASCEAADGSARQLGCLRYLQGVTAMYDLIAAEGKDPGWFCTPRDAPSNMLRQQYLGWASENADQMNLDAIQAVRLALTDAFPCQE